MAKQEKIEETVERESTQYTREPGKLYKGQLQRTLELLQGLPQKNPLAYEISRVVKAVEEQIIPFMKRRSDLMSEYLLRDENGNWTVTDQSRKTIEAASKQGLRLIPTEFGYVVDGGEEAKFEYKEKMNKLLNTEVNLEVKSVDAGKKTVKVGEERLPLLDVISDYFEIDQINLLDELKILTGL